MNAKEFIAKHLENTYKDTCKCELCKELREDIDSVIANEIALEARVVRLRKKVAQFIEAADAAGVECIIFYDKPMLVDKKVLEALYSIGLAHRK